MVSGGSNIVITMNIDFPVTSSWFSEGGIRLDARPYLSGGYAAKALLAKLKAPKVALMSLTKEGRGIFIAPYFKRIYVDDPQYGIPLLGNTEILMSDLNMAPLLARKVVQQYGDALKLKKGWTLITCFGTIGKMAFCRREMADCAGSTNFLRIVPDEEKILPGYLYAFLSSKYGALLVTEQKTGSVVENLLPQHIAGLPVPRLAEDIENTAHELIESAAANRSKASILLEEAKGGVIDYFGFKQPIPLYKYKQPSVTITSSYMTQQRLDGYYFAKWNEDAVAEFSKVPGKQRVELGDPSITKDVYIPDIFKRFYAENPASGYPYLSGAEVYRLAPTSDRYLSKRVPNIKELVLHNGMILVQDSGQLGGLIGWPVMVGRHLDGFACTNNMVRIVPHSEEDQGYIYTILSTDYGTRLLMREATGSSIPHLEVRRVKRIQIPWVDKEMRRQLGQKALFAKHLRDDACELEAKAKELVEKAIEQG
jgi:type I restriction enzyme, S subunit